jgi:replicative DNA helicase
MDFLVPHSIDAEEAVLGSILMDDSAIEMVADRLQASDFYRPKNQWVWAACVDLYNRHEAINAITVGIELKKAGKLEDLGGIPYLSNLINNTPTSVHCEYYADQVYQFARKRELISKGQEIAAIGYGNEPLQESGNKALGLMLQFNQAIQKDGGFEPISEASTTAYDETMDLMNGVRVIPGAATGFKRLDKILGGYQSVFHILAARPGMGKTQIMLASARWGAKQNSKAAIFSLETPRELLASRLAYAEAGIDKTELRMNVYSNKLTMEQRDSLNSALVKAYSVVHDLPILIDDRSGLTTTDIRARLERLMATEKIGVVWVDHLGKITDKAKNLFERTTLVSNRLADMAKDLRIPIIALCQLNRNVEHRAEGDRRPDLSDLRNSGEIEQDARVVLGLYRESYYNPDGAPEPRKLECLVLKQSEGASRQMVPLDYNYRTGRISDWEAI